MRQNIDAVRTLLQIQKIENLNSGLDLAAGSQNSFIVELLLKYGANVNQTRTNDGMTPLMFAALGGDSKKVRLLLYYKANKKTKDLNGKTAL